MKCLLKYQWVKLPRTHLPAGKGVMGYWAKLATKAAFRKGKANYCGHINEVDVGTWSGGVVGLKSILGIKSRQKTLEVMEILAYLGYIEYTLDPKTITAMLRQYRGQQIEDSFKLGDAWKNDNLVFVHEDGAPLHPHRPYKWFTEFLERHSLPKITYHQLRHTNASLLIIGRRGCCDT